MKIKIVLNFFPILLILRSAKAGPRNTLEIKDMNLIVNLLQRGNLEVAAKQLWRLKEPTKAIVSVVNNSLVSISQELKNMNNLIQFIDRAAEEKAKIFKENKCIAVASLFHPLMDTLFTGSVTRKSSWYILIYRLLYKMEDIVRSDVTGNCKSVSEYDKYSSDMAEMMAVFVTERYACLQNQHCPRGWPTASIRDVLRAFSDYQKNNRSSEAIEYYTKIYAMSWLTHGWKLKDELAVREEHSMNMLNLAYLLWDDWDSSKNLEKADWIPSEEIYEPLILDFPDTISQIFWAPKCAIRNVESGEYLHVARRGRNSNLYLKKMLEGIGKNDNLNIVWWKPRPFITEDQKGFKKVNFELELVIGEGKLEYEREYLCVERNNQITLCDNSKRNKYDGWNLLPKTIRINSREAKNVFQISANNMRDKTKYTLKQEYFPGNKNLSRVTILPPSLNDNGYWDFVCE